MIGAAEAMSEKKITICKMIDSNFTSEVSARSEVIKCVEKEGKVEMMSRICFSITRTHDCD